MTTLKSTCDNPQAQYAIVRITQITSPPTYDTATFIPQVFYLNGTAYTQSIKLKVGTYKVTDFKMMNDNNTPLNTADDILVLAAPYTSSTYGSYTNTPLPLTTTVTAFQKNEIPISVLCFEETNYEKFGFGWFRISQINIREQLFFGDLCLKHPEEYAGSPYANMPGGLKIDMPALFKIRIFTDNVLTDSVTNNKWTGTTWDYINKPLSVTYVDQPNVVNQFKFELYILVKVGNTFQYKLFNTWTFADAERISAGTDNVVDFVLGNCNINQADLILAPYINLPATATYKITAWAPGTMGTYVDALLSNIPSGYELSNGTWPSWCADKNLTIQINQNYNMDVYSTLYPALIPEFARKATIWPKVNWLMNNLNYFPTASMQDIQDAIWRLVNSPAYTGGSSLAITMANTAATNGANFVPLPGGWAAVIFVPTGTPINAQNATIQTMFIRVDP